jgi:hypothetical protein
MVKTTRDVVVGINSVTGDGERSPSLSEAESTEYGDIARPAFFDTGARLERDV